MDGTQFDRWTRLFAVGRSRRQALRAVVGAALGVGLAARPVAAHHCQTGIHCGTRPGGIAPCCLAGQICCTNLSGDGFCCPAAGNQCSSACGGCVPKGATCCCGGDGRCTACVAEKFCCIRDNGSKNCCTKGAHVCDPLSGCRLACPAGQDKCGNFCCRPGEICLPTAQACVRFGPQGPRPTRPNTPRPTLICPLAKPDNCGGTCVNLKTDDNNCGKCGVACGPLACLGGVCACPTLRECFGSCCPKGQTCRGTGTCRPCDPLCEFPGPHGECFTGPAIFRITCPLGLTESTSPVWPSYYCGSCKRCFNGMCTDDSAIPGLLISCLPC